MDVLSEWEDFLNRCDEELNYEYEEADTQEILCSERSSPVDFLSSDSEESSDEDDACKKLRRNFTIVDGVQKRPYLKKKWKYNMKKKGMLKRWRIKALDYLFLVDANHKSENRRNKRAMGNSSSSYCKKRIYDKDKDVPESEVLPENVEDFSIIINNDLCADPAMEPKVCISTRSIDELCKQVEKFQKRGMIGFMRQLTLQR